MAEFENIKGLFYETSVVSTKVLETNGLTRNTISQLLSNNVLEKVGFGKYCLKDDFADEFYMIQMRSEKIVFSHSTALYLHNLTDRVPLVYDVTVPQGYNVSKVKRDFCNINFHYSKSELWTLGLETTTTPLGSSIKVYDMERTVLDIMRKKKSIDSQVYIQAIKGYFGGQVNLKKLLKYAKLMNMEDKVREYIEIL